MCNLWAHFCDPNDLRQIVSFIVKYLTLNISYKKLLETLFTKKKKKYAELA